MGTPLVRQQIVQTTADRKQFTVPFPYIFKDHISVRVNGEDVPFTWVSGSLIELVTAPALGSNVDIRRETDRHDLLVNFQGGSVLTESQLALASRQSFYLAQEAFASALGGLDSLRVNSFPAPEGMTGYVRYNPNEYLLTFFLEQGERGPKGETGAKGPVGAEGPIGPEGPRGPQGERGVTGDQGPRGKQGVVGPEGAIGPEGPQGTQGVIGPEGPLGPEGPQGIEGPDGPIGPEGPDGPRGAPGPEGDKGPQGDMGATPLGLAFGRMEIREDGFLWMEYYGEANDNDFWINEEGDLFVSTVEV